MTAAVPELAAVIANSVTTLEYNRYRDLSVLFSQKHHAIVTIPASDEKGNDHGFYDSLCV